MSSHSPHSSGTPETDNETGHPSSKPENTVPASELGAAAAPEVELPASEEAPAAPDWEAEAAKLKDQLLRTLAESENVRRRMQKELDDARKYAVASFAKEVLGVSDNFQRALDAVPKDGAGSESLTQLVTGIEATERQLQATLDRFGIKKVDPLGEMFDPNFHQVMMEQEDPSKAPGTIVMVMQPGYMIHDRLLREALVAVAKGGVATKAPAATGHKLDTSA